MPATYFAAAAAKSLQSCLTLCDPIDGSPPGPAVPGILQARTLEWAAISSSNAWKWKVKVKSLSRVRLIATPWTAAYQAPPSMGFSKQWTSLQRCLENKIGVRNRKGKGRTTCFLHFLILEKAGIRIFLAFKILSLMTGRFQRYIVCKYRVRLCNLMHHGPPGSSVHGILQARVLEWVAISFSRGSSWPRDQTYVSCRLHLQAGSWPLSVTRG